MKKALSLILAVILCFGAMIPAFAADEIPEGYTPIYTAEDLNNIRNNLSGSYILMNDIDLSEYNWVAIGTYDEPFTGTFDGNGKIIDNLTIQVFVEEDLTYAAFFGVVNDGTIKNAVIKNCDIDIETAESKSQVVRAAGLVSFGNKNANIENCITSGSISILSENKVFAGGVGAYFNGKTNNCKNQINITIENPYDTTSWIRIGGIVGYTKNEINNSCNYGNLSVTINQTKTYGGIYIGGIVGESVNGTVNNCYNTGTLSADTNMPLHLGGISGYSTTITNSHNYGAFSVSEGDSAVGGISGQTEFWSQSGIGESEIIAELTNCYYVNETIPSTDHPDEELMTNVKHLTEEEFKSQESFVGFDFENVWTMNEEQTYPVLRNEPQIIENEPEPEPPAEPDCLLIRIAKWICRTVLYLFNTIKGLL